MVFISEDLAKATKTAIEMEEEGYRVYMEAAAKSKNLLGVNTLKSIAEKELLHKKVIEDFYFNLTGQRIDTVSFSNAKQWSEQIKKEIFEKIKDQLQSSLQSSNEAEDFLKKTYEIAMEMEQKGYKFYKEISKNTDNEDAKKLFDFLAKEENLHYEILQDTHLYLTNPSEWFKKEEKWLVEG